jgi:uncharacterized protein with NRDE domain
MCLIFLSINNHPDYKLIVAANRDEFYNRKTAPANFWQDYPHILGGRDLEAHGTWMAMTTSGKISIVTNYRDPKNIDPKAPSRGQLVTDYLLNEKNPQEYLNGVAQVGEKYNGFNLITGTASELYYYSNYKSGVERIQSGLHGLSNSLLDTPWPKVKQGLEKFKEINELLSIQPHELFQFLYDTQRASDEQLPDTGIGLERERALSSMFIKTSGYGTRCSTVILIDKNDQVQFAERVYDLETFQFQDRSYQFSIGRK